MKLLYSKGSSCKSVFGKGFCIDLIKHISDILNFKYNIKVRSVAFSAKCLSTKDCSNPYD